jgi:hypothetical protein
LDLIYLQTSSVSSVSWTSSLDDFMYNYTPVTAAIPKMITMCEAVLANKEFMGEFESVQLFEMSECCTALTFASLVRDFSLCLRLLCVQ